MADGAPSVPVTPDKSVDGVHSGEPTPNAAGSLLGKTPSPAKAGPGRPKFAHLNPLQQALGPKVKFAKKLHQGTIERMDKLIADGVAPNAATLLARLLNPEVIEATGQIKNYNIEDFLLSKAVSVVHCPCCTCVGRALTDDDIEGMVDMYKDILVIGRLQAATTLRAEVDDWTWAGPGLETTCTCKESQGECPSLVHDHDIGALQHGRSMRGLGDNHEALHQREHSACKSATQKQ